VRFECASVLVYKERIARALVHVRISVNQNHIYMPYMTVYLAISMPNIPGIHHMVLANPIKSYTQGTS